MPNDEWFSQDDKDVKVVSLEIKRNEPIPSLVECLESLLERAKSGEMRSIVYLCFERNGESESGNSGERFNRDYVIGMFARAALDYYSRRREEDKGE